MAAAWAKYSLSFIHDLARPIILGMLVSLNDEVKEQLNEAAQQTSKAYAAVRKGSESGDGASRTAIQDVKTLSVAHCLGQDIIIMQPILRFLQLLCENHNWDMQVS